MTPGDLDILARTIPLTREKMALVDADDYEMLATHRWHCSKFGYAIRFAKKGERGVNEKRVIWMHRVIAKPPTDMYVDHVNGNRLDNRKSNLRICTHAENCRNHSAKSKTPSGRRGVHFHKKSQKWTAWIRKDYKSIYLGLFQNIQDAVDARRAAEVKYHQDFKSREDNGR